jgi:small-conductance mechanosensitive channel
LTALVLVRTAEEQETFALALAQEMCAMKERYEAQLEEQRAELRAAQRLRADTAQRLRGELDAERQRHQQTVGPPSVLARWMLAAHSLTP